MKRRILSALFAVLLLGSLAASASAETYRGDNNWVTFTSGAAMESNFTTGTLTDVLYGLQPGDNSIFTINLTNQHQATTDWYMTNKVLESLEDASANQATAGGAYSYHLYYTRPDGTVRELYDSDTVGGENVTPAGEGLHQATNALEDWLYLDTLTTNQVGHITLEVALEGETQGNDYQDTLAKLQMNFAVELGTVPTTPTTPSNPPSRTTVVKTGDETNLGPQYIIMAVSGVLFLILGIDSVKRRKNEREERA